MNAIGCIAWGFLLALFMFIGFIFTALAVGAANAWIIQDTFAEGWDAAWDRWFITIIWAFLFSVGASSASRSRY